MTGQFAVHRGLVDLARDLMAAPDPTETHRDEVSVFKVMEKSYVQELRFSGN